MRVTTRIAIGLVATAASALALSAAAAAHVTVSPATAPADGYAKLDFSVPHGCEGAATTRLRVQIPESVPSVTPQVHPGWSVRTEEGPKDEVELFGETVTEGVGEVIWTAEEQPLPDDRLDVFGMSVRLPAAAGEVLRFPVIQECEQGVHRWIEVAAEGEDPDELEEPAPEVALVAAEEPEASEGEDEGSASEDAVVAGDEGSSAGGASTGVGIAALILGGLGFLAGGASLVRSRRNDA